MAVPLGALPVGLTVAITKFEEGVDGGPPRGCYWQVRQRPPPRLKKTLMAGRMGGGGVLPMDPTMATIESEEDVGGGAPAGVSIPSYVQTHFCSYKVKHGK
jgi:hypothetical protein